MNKGRHFIGQPTYGQLINLLDREEVREISRSNGGEHYVKHFDALQHLLIMLYAVIKEVRLSLRNHGLNVPGGTQTGASWNQHDASQKHSVRCQCEKA